MSPRKAAVRLLTLSADQRRAHAREYFSADSVKKATADGVTWQLDGSFDGGTLQVSYTATPDDPSTFITGAWVFLNNGIDENAPALSCSATVLDGIQSAAKNTATGATFYVPQGTLAPTVQATFIAQLNNEQQSTTSIQISTATPPGSK
jgi:hypothetical protein